MYFTDFDDLPDYDSPWYSPFFELTDGSLTRTRHYCLVGEVIDFVIFIRPRIKLKLRTGKEIIVHFYHDEVDLPTKLSLGMRLKKGKQWQFYILIKRHLWTFP